MGFISSEQKDFFHAMLKQESTTYNNYSSNSSNKYTNNQMKLNSYAHHSSLSSSSSASSSYFHNDEDDKKIQQWRHLIVSWMYVIADTFKVNHTIVAAASYYLDTAVSKGLINKKTCQPVDYQKVALAAFQLGIKCYESRVFPFSELIKLSQGDITEQDLIDMEQKLLMILNWQLHPPTPNCFLDLYIHSLQHEPSSESSNDEKKNSPREQMYWDMIKTDASKLLQIVISNGSFSSYPSSVIALASLLIVFHKRLIVPTSSSFDQIGQLVGTKHLQEILFDIQTTLIARHSMELVSSVVNQLEALWLLVDNDGTTTTNQCNTTLMEQEQQEKQHCQEQPEKPTNKEIDEDDIQTVATTEESIFQDDELDTYDDESEEEERCCAGFFSSSRFFKRTQHVSPCQVVIER